MTTHKTLTAALAAFQAELPKVGKHATNPHFKSKYADLADVVAVVLPALAKQGLAWATVPTMTDSGFVLQYELRHESGEVIAGEWPLPDPTKAQPQQLGSAVTYAKRYTLSAVTGIAPDDDDDGNAASADGAPRAQRRQQPQAAPREPAEPPALPPQGAQEWTTAIASCTSKEKLRALWGKAQEMQVLAHLMPNGRSLQDTIKAASDLLDEPLPEPPADEVEAEVIEGEIIEPVASDA